MAIIPDYNHDIPRWPFGKYRDASIEITIRHDPKYIVWAWGFLEFMESNKDFIQKKWDETWPNTQIH
jgi:hypothetical protein